MRVRGGIPIVLLYIYVFVLGLSGYAGAPIRPKLIILGPILQATVIFIQPK